MDYKTILNETIKVAKGAASIFLNNKFNVYEKDGITNLVTTSDIAVQNYLVENLKNVIKESAFFCEENDVHDKDKEYVWIIDPIDGTTNFSRGIYECSISIGLKHKSEIVMGVVYVPYLDDLYYAIKGEGAFHNSNPIHVSNKSFKESLFFNALSQYNKEYSSYSFDILHELFEKANDVRRFGSAAVELSMIASGKLDLFFEIKLSPWDYAAGSLIITEAGGYISTYDKNPVDLDKPSMIIASNAKENFDELHRIVLKHIKKMPY